MTEKQRIWLWVFIAMFVVPEILFLITPLSILSFINNFSKTDINPPIYYIINQQFFIDYPVYSLLAIVIEWLGVLGLLIKTIKSNKKALATVLAIFLLWLSFILFLAYSFSTMELII